MRCATDLGLCLGKVAGSGNSLSLFGWVMGGCGEVLRGSCSDAAGAKSGAYFIKRSTSEHGNRYGPYPPSGIQSECWAESIVD